MAAAGESSAPELSVAALRAGWFGSGDVHQYWLTRFVLMRGLGFIYFVAFFSLTQQVLPLIGSDGLMPVGAFLTLVREDAGSSGSAFWQLPTLFWWKHSDALLAALAWLGTGLSLAVVAGFANAPLMAILWLLYLSFVHVGQTFYGYGWEMLLLEAGFLAVFLAPPWQLWPFARTERPWVVIWMYRWLVFRVMLGAGLIKLRGDDCWTDLTCLVWHYETQPNPHPLSWLLHQAPVWFHQVGVLFNHVAELIAPWFVFGPRRLRHVAGLLLVAFQIMLILSGNLSFLNWLTLVVCLSCFDDSFLQRLLPRRWTERARRLDFGAAPTRLRKGVLTTWAVCVGILSLNPIFNMLGPRQRMNASYDPFHWVNTYGAFGSVGKERFEVILEGTDSPVPDERARWREYEIPCKPGAPERAPCLVTPYHYRLEWQMWFAALSDYRREPWIVHLVYKLLRNDTTVLRLLEHNPFPDAPPRFVRARLFRYRFTSAGEPGWWRRQPVGEYLRPLSVDDPQLLNFLRARNWLEH